MAANKCNITTYALQNLAGLIYGFNCNDAVCKIAENYMESLGCPIDYQTCNPSDCEAVSEVVTCLPPSASNLAVSNVTYNSATITFTTPIHPYTLLVMQGVKVVLLVQNPTSPVQLVDLASDTDFQVTFTVHCPHGEDQISLANFHTEKVCVELLSITLSTEDAG